jgi:hypothetical protein
MMTELRLDEMGKTKNSYNYFIKKLIENRPHGSQGLTEECYIRTEKGSHDIKMWLKLVQNRVRWQLMVVTALKLRILLPEG